MDRKDTRVGIWILVALLLPAVVTEVRGAAWRPFWADEICTFAVASQRSISAMWQALASAADTQPPFFYIATAAGRLVSSNPHIAYRLPALVGFFSVPLCLYLFVARRVGISAGLVAALVPLATGFQGYASEARPYGFEVGCFAVAAVCWQRLEKSRWFAVPLGLSLMGAVASHYYAVMAIPSFILAEAVRWYRTRQFRLEAWLPMGLCGLPLVIALPLARVVRLVYGAHFWTGRGFQALLFTYAGLTGLGVSVAVGVIAVLGLIMAARALSVVPAVANLWPEPWRREARPEECALAALLLAFPLVTFIVGMVTHGGVIMRYALPTVLGLAIATAFVASWLGPAVTAMLLAALVTNYTFASVVKARVVFHAQPRSIVENSMSGSFDPMIRAIPSPESVVVSSGIDYLTLAFYSAPDVTSRMLTLFDPDEAVKAIGTDTADREALALKPYLGLNVQDYPSFRAAHKRFLLYSTATNFDWWPARLAREGHTLTLRYEDGTNRLYEVELHP